MNWMNRMDVEDAVINTRHLPVLGRAARFLKAWVEAVDSCSDGWPYWMPPSRAAAKLMELMPRLFQRPSLDITEKQFRDALKPITACARRYGDKGLKMPLVEEPVPA